MKAWLVKEKDECCATVVFAETRGKAKVLAQRTEVCEDVRFCDIEARRIPEIDKYYVDGKTEMCWYLSTDRVALVKDGRFTCSRDYWKPEDCETCPAAEYCDMYKDYVLDREEETE